MCLLCGRLTISRGGVGCGRGGATTASRSSRVGGIHLHLERDHGNQLRLPQQQAPTASLLDVLGPWPVYLLTEITIVLIVWALMTWPWERIRRHADESPSVV
jgi:hypothetical protein